MIEDKGARKNTNTIQQESNATRKECNKYLNNEQSKNKLYT